MNKKVIVGILVGIILTLCLYIAWNGLRTKRNFIVLFNKKLNFCLLVDDRYKFKLGESSLSYSGGKNSGELSLIQAGISQDAIKVNINGFKAGYKKLKNVRVYEYQLSENFIIRDNFINKEKSIVNLVPYRIECSKIKNNFKNHIEIFRSEK